MDAAVAVGEWCCELALDSARAKGVDDGDDDRNRLHCEQARKEPSSRDEPLVYFCDCGVVRVGKHKPQRCSRKASDESKSSLPRPIVSVVNISNLQEDVGAKDGSPKGLPEHGWNPFCATATLGRIHMVGDEPVRLVEAPRSEEEHERNAELERFRNTTREISERC